ncbi:uncharacterized protein LOC135844658 [Planococcus citri]|uniref:uncharacterized protein LOC135844658 n=1 Tax=Planococcus citri TaxID=170843 RepID=UPI0031F79EC9
MANEKNLKESILGASPFLIKVLELVLALLSISLIISPYNKVQPSNGKSGLIYSAFTGAILINILIIVCHFIGERIPKKACLIISCFYGVFMLIAGFIVIQDWRNIQTNIYARQFKYHMDMMLASGVFSIFTSVSFFADIGLTIKYA